MLNKKKQIFTLILICVLFFPLTIFSQEKKYPIETINGTKYYIYHAETSEGIYAIGRKFDIKPDEIIQHNPELKEGLKANQKVLVPVNPETPFPVITQPVPPKSGSYIELTIQKEHTLYSLSKQYNTTVENILKANEGLTPESFSIGRTIFIPVTEEASVSQSNSPGINLSQVFSSARKMGEINVALILPFLQGSESTRFIEFYEGMLLALEDLKKQNISINLFVYDTGNPRDELSSIFNKPEMEFIDMIIGPVNSEQIRVVSDYAERNQIPLVLPFTSSSTESNYNNCVYQVNTPQKLLYEEVAKRFVERFSLSEIWFLHMEGHRAQKEDFVSYLKSTLKKNNVSYRETTQSIESLPGMTADFSIAKENVLITDSHDSFILRNVLPVVRTQLENDSINNPVSVTLFGYPEWQREKEVFDTFYSLNTFIYSSFYDDVFSIKSKDFYKRFNTWYSKNILTDYPKYSLLGYDVGTFFLKTLHAYGKEGINRIGSIKSSGVQSGFKFEKLNDGGYVNKNIYFINFRPDYTIEKIDFNR